MLVAAFGNQSYLSLCPLFALSLRLDHRNIAKRQKLLSLDELLLAQIAAYDVSYTEIVA